jgi:glucosamine kinase
VTAFLAIDVGGSTSRATLVDAGGVCLGRGKNRGGNPASNTPDLAASAIIAAAESAVADAGGPLEIGVALIAMAGPRVHVAQTRLEEAFARLGLAGPLIFTGDLHAMLASVTASTSGYCIVCGTGAGAVRLRNGEIDAVIDAAGWLLGDAGSGYWLGHQAARAVTADLEGHGEKTTLTLAMLHALDIAWSDGRASDSRRNPLRFLIDKVYAMRPIELARFAPLVIAHRDDPVAARLLREAEGYLLRDFEFVFDSRMPGPVGLGGGIVAHLTGLPDAIAAVIRKAGHVPDIRRVTDGSVGAVVLALRAAGIAVDEGMVQRISVSLMERAASTTTV